MKEKCTSPYAFGCNPQRGLSGCFLNLQLESQAKSGGLSSELIAGKNGSFWQEIKWNKYITDLRNAAEQGCACAQKLIERANKISNDKKNSGELI